ncbi:tRNA pseudouridine(55) synthase TruB [Roseivirga sp. UBA1976]|uniref:tRNA pseudouridine(55) synthase TruB n=1 Tax=Roseivirga sp. UBA1976 TaxID=1947386 RepID=UPI00257D5D11|nr:tRNA pseudouridine(55) synthase TruB [Roseivirga sp. UBA1976]|tara:strand:+ start:336 stop:1037 length:702 start_codon:yes stop_codon:yes gene_type:complete
MLNLDPELSKQENFLAGQVLLIDKPLEWTSFDVVKKVRNNIRIKKVGHAGTLDPLATGLLIICTGKKTKQIEQFMGQEKEYTGTFTLGQTTPTYDLESAPSVAVQTSHLTITDLESARDQFLGTINQVPPIHSAIKVDGKRVYELARKGEDIQLKSRQVVISEFELTKVDLPTVEFRVVCSKGTYIRSLANDFGEALGVGAHLSSLRRTRIGQFSVENAHQLDQLVDYLKQLT